MSEWFKTWFDSDYYYLLYKDRDHTDAEKFINNIYQYLNPNPNDTVLDLACGKGRHSIYLNRMGASVEGCDYSENSINYAKQFENDRLRFYTHDMRNSLPKTYDYIFNLFTSFGYFESIEEHQMTLQNIFNGLNDKGLFIFDFMKYPLLYFVLLFSIPLVPRFDTIDVIAIQWFCFSLINSFKNLSAYGTWNPPIKVLLVLFATAIFIILLQI